MTAPLPSRYDRLFTLIHQAARQAHLRTQGTRCDQAASHSLLHLRVAAQRSLGHPSADQTLRDALRP